MSTVRTSQRDVNYFSIAGNVTNFNPTADTSVGAGQVGATIPATLEPDQALVGGAVDIANWQWAGDFASFLKICDGTCNRVLQFDVIEQGLECAVDIANKVKNVTLIANSFGNAGRIGNQVISIKGGCDGIRLKGKIASSGKHWSVLIGNWCDECQDVDKNLDLSQLDPDEPIAIGRGLMGYLFGNKNSITLGACKVTLFWSFMNWFYWWGKRAYVGIVNLLPKKDQVLVDAKAGT